ncbi:MAG: VCBS domain-containing protein [Colwellia sp.]
MNDNIHKDKSLLNEQESNADLVANSDKPINNSVDVDALAEIEAGDEPIEESETATGEKNSGGFDVVSVAREASETIASTDFKTASFTFNVTSTEITDTSANIGTVTVVTPVPSDLPLIAQFTDNFVSGVTYSTSSGLTGVTGSTGVAGEFKYNEGDIITFTIGDVIIGEFSADVINGDVLFLQDIAGTDLSDSNSNYVENMAIFLQALDDDLTDDNSADGILRTNSLVDNEASYSTNITITQETLDAFTGYIDPKTGEVLNLSTSGKEMISQALATVGIEFTRESEMDESGNNIFETIAMAHVAETIEALAGDRTPEEVDLRVVDTIEIPGGLIHFNFAETDGVITFTTDDLLVGTVGKQVTVENLVVDNVKLSADFADIGTLVNKGDGHYEIQLNDGVTGKELEGLAIDYRVEDWTVSTEVTSQSLDSYKAHLSADIDDVTEDIGFNQFTLNSSLSFDSNTLLEINFTSELLSEQLTAQIQQELTALGKDVVLENSITQIAEYADDYIVPLEYSNDGGVTWVEMTVVSLDTTGSIPRPIFGFELAAGNDSIEIRIPIFDDVIIESTEYFRAEVSGENFYDETLIFAIEDNDSDTDSSSLPRIDIDYVLVTEGQGDAVFTLTLSEASTDVVTVDYSTTELSALFGEDFEAAEGTVTFAPGETTATLSIVITDDFIAEGSPEFALVNLSNATNALIDDPQGTLRIFDNDSPVEITVSNTEVTEGDVASFTIELDKDPITNNFLMLNVALSAEEADLTDYDPASITAYYGDISSPQYLAIDQSGNIIIPIDVDSITVTVNTLDDAIVESTEQLTLTAKVGDNVAQGSVDIIDNDNAPTVIDQNISYEENQSAGNVVGSLAINADVASYTFDNGTQFSDDGYYSISDEGEITITEVGSESSLNNFESETNNATYAVRASDEAGNETNFTVKLVASDIDDETTLTLTAGSATEDSTVAGATVASFSVSDEDESAIVDFTSGTNDEGYYAISGSNIVLTPQGEAYLDAGNLLPEISLITSGTSTDKTAIATPTTTLVDDETVLTLTAGSATEDSTVAGATVASFSVSDEDESAIVDFTVNSNDEGYYAISGSNIVLTTQGEAYLDAGNLLPEISLTTQGTSTHITETVTPVTILVNDVEILTISDGSALEDSTAAGTVMGSYTLMDEAGEAALTIDFTAGTNTNNYYVLDGVDVKLTIAGEIYLDAGNSLPNISLTSSDGVSASNTVTTILVNDAATVVSEDITLMETDAILTTSGTLTSSDEDNVDDTFTPSSSIGSIGNFTIGVSGEWTFISNSTFDSLGETQSVNETFNVTSIDGTSSTVKITIKGTNDAPTIDTAVGSTQTENLAREGDTVATFTASDLESDVITFSITGGNTLGYFEITDNTIGVVTLTAAGEAALANDALADTNYTLGVTANDGTVNSSEVTETVKFDGINDAPIAIDDNIAPIEPSIRLDEAPGNGVMEVYENGDWVEMIVGKNYAADTEVQFVPNIEAIVTDTRDIQIGTALGEVAELSDWGQEVNADNNEIINTVTGVGVDDVIVTTSVVGVFEVKTEVDDGHYISHIGNGIGDGANGSNGLSNDETLRVAISGENINQISFVLSGIGSWFDSTQRDAHRTQIVISAYRENGSIIEEIEKYRDDPEGVVYENAGHDIATYTFSFDEPVAYFILGTSEGSGSYVVQSMTLSRTLTEDVTITTVQADGTVITEEVSFELTEGNAVTAINMRDPVDYFPIINEGVTEGPIITDASNPINIDVLNNDSDEEGDTLTISHIGDQAVANNESVTITDNNNEVLGTAELVDGLIKFTPNPNIIIPDDGSKEVTFEYTLWDGELSSSATVTLNVEAGLIINVADDVYTVPLLTSIVAESIIGLGTSRYDGSADTENIETKTFSFGEENANETITLTFNVEAAGDWEVSGEYADVFIISGNGETLSTLTYSVSGSGSYSHEVTLDEYGDAVIEFNVKSTGDMELVDITEINATLTPSFFILDVLNNDSGTLTIDSVETPTDVNGKSLGTVDIINDGMQIQFTPISSDVNQEISFAYTVTNGIRSVSATITLAINSGRFIILGSDIPTLGKASEFESEIITQTYDFGSENAGETVTLTFDSVAKGSWDFDADSLAITISDGSEAVTKTITYDSSLVGEEDEAADADESNSWHQSHRYAVVLDADGKVTIEFDENTTADDEYIDISNMQATLTYSSLTSLSYDSALIAGEGVDTFIWTEGETGVDHIANFNSAEDVLDISDLLQINDGDNLNDLLDFDSDGTDTIITLYAEIGSDITQTIVLDGVNLGSDDVTIINDMLTGDIAGSLFIGENISVDSAAIVVEIPDEQVIIV